MYKMRGLLFVSLFLINIFTAESTDIDLKHLKCLVCRATMKELQDEISKANPNTLVEVGVYRMDAKGNTIHKKVPLSQSEVYISDVLDNICEKMTDYVRATKKSNNQLTILNLMSSGSMNPLMSEVDVIQDGDLNKSLQHYCSDIVGEFEDDIISLYVNNKLNKKEMLCTKISNICNDDYIDEDDEDINADDEIDSNNYITNHDYDEDRDEL
ncbi:protein seele [Nylanderia fulva]|uniref:protein seele n=1 Tax=Nylanderia fulva TaxID=613905 RepID=UPI0010FB2EB5|nr:protein seele [Nylanderia fulva]XP_029167578.1 protein seele [Nylanderia fulva]